VAMKTVQIAIGRNDLGHDGFFCAQLCYE
jgi:hypothetical protein